MNIFNPSAFYLLPLLGVILFFYLLKGRAREIKVSSILFWQNVRQTLTSQHIRWRLPPELLLFLQLAIFGILIMALAQIFLNLKGRGDEYLAIIMDTTASMKAMDITPDRLSVAKKKARELIKQLPRKTKIALIQADDHPHLLVNFSDDRTFLLKKLENLTALDVKGDEEVALTLAASLLPAGSRRRILFFTDGAFKVNPDSVPQEARLVPFTSTSPHNIGITSLQIRPKIIGGKDYEILVKMGNFSPQEEIFSLKLWMGEEIISNKKLSLLPQEEDEYIHSVEVGKKFILKAELESHSRDDLAIDNVAYAVFDPFKNLNVLLVSQGNLFLETALNAYSCVNLYIKDRVFGQEISNYDLVIFDGITPPVLDQGNIVCIGTLPPGLLAEEPNLQVNPVLTEWEVEHSLLRFVDLSNTNVERSLSVQPFSGGEVLIKSRGIPLMQTWQKENLRLVFVAFDLYYSNFPLQVSFPIFIFNLLQWFHPEVFDPGYYQIQTGKGFPIPPGYEDGEVVIISPHNEISKFENIKPRFIFSQTKTAGVYRLNGEPLFAANLTSSEESSLFSQAELPLLGKDIPKQLESGLEERKLNLSLIFILISSLLLLAEWYLYNFPLKRNR